MSAVPARRLVAVDLPGPDLLVVGRVPRMRSPWSDISELLPRQLLNLGIGPQGSDIGLEEDVVAFQLCKLGACGIDRAVGIKYLAGWDHLSQKGGTHKKEQKRCYGCAGSTKKGHGDLRKVSQPAKRASLPIISSIRSNWLYLAVRSPRAGAPVFICPAFVATDRWDMKVSSVSPLR